MFYFLKCVPTLVGRGGTQRSWDSVLTFSEFIFEGFPNPKGVLLPPLNKFLRSRSPGRILVPGVFNILLYCHLFMNQNTPGTQVGPGYCDKTLPVKRGKHPKISFCKKFFESK